MEKCRNSVIAPCSGEYKVEEYNAWEIINFAPQCRS
jgi:hypothetical protein